MLDTAPSCHNPKTPSPWNKTLWIFVSLLKKSGELPGSIWDKFFDSAQIEPGGEMGFLVDVITNVNWEVIFQLLFVSLIMIAGPVVIFVLAFRGGDL